MSVVVAGEASESDEEVEEMQSSSSLPTLEVDTKQKGDSFYGEPSSPTLSASPPSSPSTERPKYDSLLHKILRNKNCAFHADLTATLGQVYMSAAKELKNTSQQLVKSKTMVQDISLNMQQVTNDLFHMEDRIDIISSCNILPLININSSPPGGAVAASTT